eukprot:14126_1
MPFLEMILVMGPVMDSHDWLKASSGVMPCAMRLKSTSTMPCTAPKRMPRSPMSEQYSSLSVVSKTKGEPMAMAQPSAMSVALPVLSWCTANEALMPEPPTVLPCSRRRTEGPMPLGATSTTLMSSRNFSPRDSRCPRRKPWERPSVAPFLISGSNLVLSV